MAADYDDLFGTDDDDESPPTPQPPRSPAPPPPFLGPPSLIARPAADSGGRHARPVPSEGPDLNGRNGVALPHAPTHALDTGRDGATRANAEALTRRIRQRPASAAPGGGVRVDGKRAIPRRGWRRWIYAVTRVNVGPSARERRDDAMRARIGRDVRGCHPIAVVGLKGGVGRTSVTVSLGSALAKVRGHGVLALDADPGAGNLADLAGNDDGRTVTDLLAGAAARTHDTTTGGLEVVAGQDYGGARNALTRDDWSAALRVATRFHDVVLSDCGRDLYAPATEAALATASGLVIVVSATPDALRQSALAIDWLKQHDRHDLVANACLVVNDTVPGRRRSAVRELVRRLDPLVGRVVALPWDAHLASDSVIDLDELSAEYLNAVTELAGMLSDDYGDGPPR